MTAPSVQSGAPANGNLGGAQNAIGEEGVAQHDSGARPESQSAEHSHARLYVRRLGWSLLPTDPITKAPLGGQGVAHATTDPGQIDRWWRRWPNACPAVACKASGLVVIDLDRHEGGADGFATWEARFGHEPHGAALVASTPNNGEHRLYRAPRDVEVQSQTNWLAGVDVKAGGGEHGQYIVLPCGRSGRQWVEGDPGEDELEEPPAWLLEELPKVGQRAAPSESEFVAPAIDAAEDVRREVASALHSIPASVGRSRWLQVIFAVHAALQGDPRGAALVEAWSSTSDVPNQYKPGEATSVYKAAVPPEAFADGEAVDRGTLFAVARQCGWQGVAGGVSESIEPGGDLAPMPNGAVRTLTELGLAALDEEPEPEEQPDPIHVADWFEVADRPPVEFLIEGLVPERAVAVLAGDPAAGKSFVALDWCLRMVHGPHSWLGRRMEAGSAVFLAGEGDAGLAGRLRAWRQQHDASPAQAGGRYFAIADGIPGVESAAGRKKFGQFIDAIVEKWGHPPSLVVVDTLSQALVGGDENSSKDVAPVLRFLSGLRKKHGCTVLVIHHLAKPPKGGSPAALSQHAVRGASAIVGNVDAVLGVTVDTGGSRRLVALKQKDSEALPAIRWRLLPIETGAQCRDGSPERSCIVVPDAAASLVNPEDAKAAEQARLEERGRDYEDRLVEGLRSFGQPVPNKSTIIDITTGRKQSLQAAWDRAIASGRIVNSGTSKAPKFVPGGSERGGETPPHTPPGTGNPEPGPGSGSGSAKREPLGTNGNREPSDPDDGLPEQPGPKPKRRRRRTK